MKPKLSFAQSEIQDGDVICFQVDISEKEYVLLHPSAFLLLIVLVQGVKSLRHRACLPTPRSTTISYKIGS